MGRPSKKETSKKKLISGNRLPKVGEIVFTKVPSSRPWPSIVVCKKNSTEYRVMFYDQHEDEHSTVEAKDMFPYEENLLYIKEKYPPTTSKFSQRFQYALRECHFTPRVFSVHGYELCPTKDKCRTCTTKRKEGKSSADSLDGSATANEQGLLAASVNEDGQDVDQDMELMEIKIEEEVEIVASPIIHPRIPPRTVSRDQYDHLEDSQEDVYENVQADEVMHPDQEIAVPVSKKHKALQRNDGDVMTSNEGTSSSEHSLAIQSSLPNSGAISIMEKYLSLMNNVGPQLIGMINASKDQSTIITNRHTTSNTD